MNVPKLRFPAFTEEWEMKTLGEVAEIIMGQSPDGISYNMEGIGSPLINGPVEFTEKYPVKIKWTSKPTKFCQVADILFCVRGSTTGRMNIANDIYCIGRGIAAIRANKKSTSLFIELILIKNLEKILTYTTGSTFQNIDSKSLKEFKFNIPSFPEQQKIAAFLSSVDDKLTQLKKKKTLLEQYKKGVMQKIFSQNIRFKDENEKEFSAWTKSRLDKIIVRFIVPMRDKPKHLEGEIPWCRIEDFTGKYLSGSKSSQGVTIKTIKEMNLKVYPVNTLLVSCSANLGFCAIVKKELITNQTFIGLVPDESKVNIEFLYYVMILSSRKLNILSSGTTISYLSREQFERFEIILPCLEEQTPIANFLSAIDEKINHCSAQIEKTELWKKGLLQKMFV